LLKNTWLFPVVQSIHLAGLAFLVGTIMIRNLRLLGVFRGGVPGGLGAAELARELAPWTRAGLAAMLATGPLMFAADSGRYLNNPAFLCKMALLGLALTVQFKLPPQRGKLTAIASTVVWTLVVLAARAIADFDVY
jgi:hypothetical protein